MKTLSVTVPERLAGIAIFNNPEHKVATTDFMTWANDARKFSLTEEDKQLIGWEEIKGEDGNITSFKWSPDAQEKSIEIDEFTRKNLMEKLSKLELTLSDPLSGAVVSLIEKLK